MITYEQEMRCVSRVVAEIIKLALEDLYKPHYTEADIPEKVKDKKKWLLKHNCEVAIEREKAKFFFEKGRMFELTKLNYVALKEEYQRIHNITEEDVKKLLKEDKASVNKYKDFQADRERDQKPKGSSKKTKGTRGKLQGRPKQGKRSSK